MKRSLGKHTVWLLLATLSLCAEEFAYRMTADADTVALHTPVHIDVDLNQTDPTNILLFEFAPKKSNAYRIIQIDALHDDTPHHTHHHYRYELYPLRTGTINVAFTLVKRVTDDRKMAFSASGDRDDFKKLETVDIPVALSPLRLHVRPLHPPATLVGDFKIQAHYDKHRVEAYEPVALHIRIKGKGYPPLIDDLVPVSKNITRFTQAPELTRTLTAQGIFYEVRYALAFSASQSFTLPEHNLTAYNPFAQRYYTLRIPSHRVEVVPPQTSALIDHTDTPKPLQSPFAYLGNILGYLAAFAAGVMSAWLYRRRPVRTSKSDRGQEPLALRIDETKDKAALYRLLLSRAERFAPLIETMEQSPHLSLKELKIKAKELL